MLSIEGSARYKKWISKFKLPENLKINKKENITATGFAVTVDDFNFNYCLLFWNAHKLEYISLCPPIDLEDGTNGEIRPIVLEFTQFQSIIKKCKSELGDIEESILDLITDKRITIEVFLFDDDPWYMKHINSKRLTILTLSMVNLLFPLVKSHYTSKIVKSMELISDISVDIDDIVYHGQKLYPLTIQEDYNSDRLNFGSWRDLIIANAMSICNNHWIIPAVMKTGQSFYLFRSSRDIYDSKYVKTKYKESDQIEAHEQDSDYYETNYKIMADVTLGYDIMLKSSCKKYKLNECNLFELLYTMWYAHSELKFIHTKLQLSIFVSNRPKVTSVYVVDHNGEKDTYVFEGSEYTTEIFNYKSSIIMLSSPLIRRERIAYDNSQLFYVINVINDYIEAEILPADIRKSLESKDYWYDIFIVLCVVDYIDICEFVLSNCDSTTEKLCKKIKDISIKYMVHGLTNIIHKKLRPETTFHALWRQIKDIFNDYHYINQKKIYNNEIGVRYIYDELFNKFPKKDYMIS